MCPKVYNIKMYYKCGLNAETPTSSYLVPVKYLVELLFQNMTEDYVNITKYFEKA